ncbi:MAG: 2-amino-4-hydroxy-6-hydroxymethyldihydropteridine pyrophosphokinae [Sphingomonas bacterium]|jgi:2-amino-4-hydroxy-6-hydroxymethyldihydropteridine diphosphokinase|nr:2-amino-4-hydroxy-6-hydroxymethyldihydropteridine pyrophosphokinae [Sphingomonas bacterium]MDB5718234.1 2-amino-4-hydroxy-6-hydroxymethyldihydropteridine pyrophosphokinae [Sphingomonas bacterium]
MARTSYAIALGSNRRHGRHGDPADVIGAAVAAMAAAGLRIDAHSPLIRSAAIGPAGRGFVNGAVLVSTTLDPPALLATLKRIEAAFGRRRGRRWGPRVIDLDLALWSAGRWPPGPRRAAAGRLAIPHGQLSARDFVLRPLAAIVPGWQDPWSARTVRQLRAALLRRRL